MYSQLSPWTEDVEEKFARDLESAHGARGISQETRLQEDARAGRQGPEEEVKGPLLLRPETSRERAALRPPAGTRGSPSFLGGAEGAVAQPVGQTARDARRGSPHRIRRLRRRDPGRLRRRHRDAVGSGNVDAGDRRRRRGV